MAIQITTLYPVENSDTAAIRSALKAASLAATVRKGSGSCRCQVYITPKSSNGLKVEQATVDAITAALDGLGFELMYELLGRVYYQKVAQ